MSVPTAGFMSVVTRRGYLLGILLVLLAANYMDGLSLGLVLQDIKSDFHLSDSQLGLLSGMAFALFYSIAGIPLARWADRGNRVAIISVSALLWSVMVALCGMSGSFVQLLVLRVAVGVGEAGCVPSAHSLIADAFTRSERARAVAIFLQGNSLSIVAGYFLAGWLNQLYGWRVMFVVLGLTGVIPAVLAWTTLRDPRQQVSSHAPSVSGLQALATLWRNITFRRLLYAFCVVYFFSNGVAQWQPAFFERTFGLKSGELGSWFAAVYGVGGFVGMTMGGEWASRYAANNERLQLRVMAIAYCVYGLLLTMVYLSSNLYCALLLLSLAAVVGSMTSAPLFATIQSLVPPHMRAMSIAIIYLFANLIGFGLGPLATGILSDELGSLRTALLCMCPGFVWVAWHLWRGSVSVSDDLQRASGAKVQN